MNKQLEELFHTLNAAEKIEYYAFIDGYIEATGKLTPTEIKRLHQMGMDYVTRDWRKGKDKPS